MRLSPRDRRLPPPPAAMSMPEPLGPLARRRRGRRTLRWTGLISALLHIALVVAILLDLDPRSKPPQELPPPSFAVVFQGGSDQAPRGAEAPEEAPVTILAPPPAPPPPPLAEVPPSPAAPPRPATPPVPPPPRVAEPLPPPPPIAEPPPRVADASPTPPPPRPAEPPPTPPPVVTAPESPPPPPRRQVEAPAPPPPPAPERTPPPPQPARPPVLAERPAAPQPLPLPPPPPPPPPAPSPPAQTAERLPPLDLTRRPPIHLGDPGRSAAPRRGLDLSPGATTAGPGDTEQLRVRGAQAGPDWRNAFRQWLDQNLHYPREAIDLREQGPVTVRIQTGPDGRVRGVELRTASRSIRLNFYSQSVFRGAQLPPFPPGTAEDQVTIDLTINYILYGQ
ncbi:hypothetical protein GCM10011320_53100 [Neoroseomonas lacus]|uniref:TonB C-terminal domain-containing protein n=2 Tax=Neoroseomonas lacus TaxID=287609 RepID=A0A917L0F4_9PROT|nr:hypothetical protein GCM10011320_53100 [Neoroseomonas lacus]